MESTDIEPIEDNSGNHLFVLSPAKFVAMSLCTFGLYEVYWSYKNWKFIRDRDAANQLPFWRAVFYPLWHYSLLTELNKTLESQALSNGAYRGFLAASVIILNAAIRLPDPYWLVSILTILGFLPALFAMQKPQAFEPIQHQTRSFRPANLIAYLLGGPLFVFVALGTIGFFPSTSVVAGQDLWDRDVAYLREAEILGPDEEIEYFYSLGLWSIVEDGQFISDRYVTSYYQDPNDGETNIDFASYEEIADINIVWSDSFVEDTIATITINDDYQFEVWLSPENEGDQKFVNAMRRNWNNAKGPD